MLIVFEGIDGAGKGAQIGKLLSFFKSNKVKFKLHKYPTKKAKDAQAHLVGEKDVEPLKLARVFADDIAGEQAKIEKEIAAGFVVVCDRYMHSTLAYQGALAQYEEVRAIVEKRKCRAADLVVLLDIDEGTSLSRKSAQKEPDRFERDLQFLKKVRANYLQEAQEGFLAYKFIAVDASASADEVFTEIITAVEPMVVKRMG